MLASGEQQHVQRRRIWAVRAARLFDGYALRPGRPLVLIDGSRIAGVDMTGAPPSADLRVLDLGDATLLPGLIDSHVHLAFDPEDKSKPAMADEDAHTTLARMRVHAGQQLRAGVTTVRDLGDRDFLAVSLRDHYAAGAEAGPEILAAGPPITRTRGHCWFLGGEADGIAAVEAAVKERIARGADVVKIMATGGVITPGWGPHQSQYTRDELAAVTRAAHTSGRPVTAHAHGRQGMADAAAAGVDGIEHASFFTEDGVDPDWRTVAAVVEAGTFVGATEAWLPTGSMVAPHMAKRVEQRSANFARMHREGARLVCCSDAGAGPRKPHGVLPHGIIRLGSLGLTNTEALASATTLAAQACRLADRKGRIAVGYDADLIAVPGNPLHRLETLLDIRAVIRAGRVSKG
ncbi:amidohydrolase family protein [Streptomyces sp. XD-27]|uniref:amidohydrolase family protein n=1 Tax=Streptomyces sp. XD-27 TaxID=3062779 RepID=UPI0026F42A13|nr:amidohydrolase family protein [Streptomyces sp. XD-27]WKX73651.1 amidohydrolase family protein [Streptomyces sp. XD-27]